MKLVQVPQGPWHNPELAKGVYNAIIKLIRKGVYGAQKDEYIQFVFWLPREEVNVVTNFYFPEDKPDNKSVTRLYQLCKCIGRVPQDVRDHPKSFEDEQLQIM